MINEVNSDYILFQIYNHFMKLNNTIDLILYRRIKNKRKKKRMKEIKKEKKSQFIKVSVAF